MVLIDVHTHYNLVEGFNPRSFSVLQGIIILNGIDHETNVSCLAAANDTFKVALGFHPVSLKSKADEKAAKEEIAFITKQAKKIVAIGEIGLDHFHVKDPELQKVQEKVFRDYVLLAEQLQKPIIIHARNAATEVLTILEELIGAKKFSQSIVLHCFEASEKNIARAIALKCYFSIPPAVIRNEHFQKTVALAPMKQLLTETDAPYQGPTKGVPVTPEDVKKTLDYIAKTKGLDRLEVEHMIFANYQHVF